MAASRSPRYYIARTGDEYAPATQARSRVLPITWRRRRRLRLAPRRRHLHNQNTPGGYQSGIVCTLHPPTGTKDTRSRPSARGRRRFVRILGDISDSIPFRNQPGPKANWRQSKLARAESQLAAIAISPGRRPTGGNRPLGRALLRTPHIRATAWPLSLMPSRPRLRDLQPGDPEVIDLTRAGRPASR